MAVYLLDAPTMQSSLDKSRLTFYLGVGVTTFAQPDLTISLIAPCPSRYLDCGRYPPITE